MKTPAMNPLRAAVTTAAVLLALGACSTEEQMKAVDPAGQSDSDTDTGTSGSSDGAMPTALPAAEGEVSTGGLVTVLDDGEGPELCHAVAESFPPQCSGVPMADWAWADHPEHEDESGVKWGTFALTGTFDGTTFAVTDAIPAALYDALNEEPEPLPGTPCEPPPVGGASWTRPRPPPRRWTRPSRRPPGCPASPGPGWTSRRTPVPPTTPRR